MADICLDFIRPEPIETVIAHDVDIYRLFAYVKSQCDDCYYFESLSHPRHQDRYFSLGFAPLAKISARQNTVTIQGKPAAIEQLTGQSNTASVDYNTTNAYHFIAEQFPFNFAGTPHQGGLIGYFSHEAVNYFEPSLQLKEHALFKPFQLCLYTDGLLFDTTTQTLTYYTYGENRLELAQSLLKAASAYDIPNTLKSVQFLGHSETKENFLQAVESTREKIRQGYSFQSEVGFKSLYDIQGDKIAIYNRLRQINPSPYMFYVKNDVEEIFGASPEILISSNQGQVLTTPTAGTIHRGKSDAEDTELARQLLTNLKEIAEHNMLVDLHRNDLSRVCLPQTVKISDLMYIIKFSHVQHIVSNITGIQQPNKSAYDVLAAIFPGGVVTGAPKLETIKIIDGNESTPRGVYGGAVGRFSLSGDCDFCLPIRSIFCHQDNCYAQTSAGVVFDSVAEKEYNEVTNKLAAMQQTLRELGSQE